MSNDRRAALVVITVAALVMLPNLGGPPLWDEDEPLNAACSLAMRKTGDWIVPTFNGTLRIDKPVLVNWVQLAGFALAGVDETGARLGSAVLTIGTCLLTCLIARTILRPDVGPWAGIVMATCVWTAVAGRAATPDATLACCTTLALWCFVRGCVGPAAGGAGWSAAPVRLSAGWAAAVGAACGLAILAKGPVGLVLPLAALGGFCWWQALRDPGRVGTRTARIVSAFGDAWRGLRPLLVIAVALAVAAPWYTLVTLRTEGEWLRGFLLVHNVGRFSAPLEGHSGPAAVYYPLVILGGTFPWSVAAALVGGTVLRTCRSATAPEAAGMRLLVAWVAAWVIPFSLSGTKLPGYVWPAYPALAAAIAFFVSDWIRKPCASTDAWMRWAWALLATTGMAISVGLPVTLRRFAPGSEWLGIVGVLPLVGGAAAWTCQRLGTRHAAATCWAATACGTVVMLAAVGPGTLARDGGARRIIERLAADGDVEETSVVAFRSPPSVVFYAGRHTPRGAVTHFTRAADVAGHLARHPRAHVVATAASATKLARHLPETHEVVGTARTQPGIDDLVIIGPSPAVVATAPPEATRR